MYAVRAQNSKVGVNCFFACFLRISIYKNQQFFLKLRNTVPQTVQLVADF